MSLILGTTIAAAAVFSAVFSAAKALQTAKSENTIIGNATATIGLVSGYSEVDNPEKLAASLAAANEAVAHVTEQVATLTGYRLKPKTKNVGCDWSVYGKCPVPGETTLRVDFPLYNYPYYKDVVIMFIKLLVEQFDQSSVSIFFEMYKTPVTSKTVVEQPEWLPTVLSYGQSSKYHGNVIASEKIETMVWSLDVLIPDSENLNMYHERRRQTLQFLKTITDYGLTCTVDMIQGHMLLSGGLNTHFDSNLRDQFPQIIEKFSKLVSASIGEVQYSNVVPAEIYYSCK